ncbi:MAG: N-acetylmuramoyl-L-alanine amidase, partial [Nitrososphaerota archaeon]
MLKVKKIYSSDVVNEPYPFEDEFISSHPKCYVNGRRGESLSAIVIHYAVARNLKWLVNYFAKDIYNKDKRTASTHYCVDVDGSTVMMTKFSDTAFTVGDGGRKNYLKGYSIDNLQGGWWVQPGSGELTNKVNEISVSFETCLYPQDKVTDKIYESISNRCKYIIRNTNDTRIWRIVGHEHMVPDRKIDPGPQWDWKRFYVQ